MSIFMRLLLPLMFCLSTAFAQTIIINPATDGGFELGNTFAANGWTIVNNANNQFNNWYLSNGTLVNGTRSFAPNGNRAAFISQSPNTQVWSYDLNNYSTTHFYKDVTFPAGQDQIQLKFRWNAQGEGNSNQAYDVLYVYMCPTSITPLPNSPFGTSSVPVWNGSGTANLLGAFFSCPSNSGTTATITITPNAAGTTQRLVFTWKNGNTLGVQPPAALDSIALTSDCSKPEISFSNVQINACAHQATLNTAVQQGNANGTYQWRKNGQNLSINTPNATVANLQNGDIISCIYFSNNVCGYSDTVYTTIGGLLNPHQASETLNICRNKLPYNWRGISIPASAQSNAAYTAAPVPGASGCDSLITLNLQIMEGPPTVVETLQLCPGSLGQVHWRGRLIPPSASTNDRFDSVYQANQLGCDSLFVLKLIVKENYTEDDVYLSGCDKASYQGRNYSRDTSFVDTIKNRFGCDSVHRIVHIDLENFLLNLQANPSEPVEGEWVTLSAEASVPFNILSWSPNNLFPHQNLTRQFVQAQGPLDIQVIAQSATGCLDTAVLHLSTQAFSKEFRMPNAFTPNGDGRNDVFAPVIKMARGYTITAFEIFDRWGNMVFASHQSTGASGWDGTFNGRAMPMGTYFYRISIYFPDKTTQTQNGDLHLIR